MRHPSTCLVTSFGVCAIVTSHAYATQPPDVVTSDARDNTAMGRDALSQLTLAYSNTASGTNAMRT